MRVRLELGAIESSCYGRPIRQVGTPEERVEGVRLLGYANRNIWRHLYINFLIKLGFRNPLREDLSVYESELHEAELQEKRRQHQRTLGLEEV